MFRFSTLLLLAAFAASPVGAQTKTAQPIKRHSPLGYFWRSFLVPGWGQAELDRKFTGGFFVAVEGISLGMGMKAHYEIEYLKRSGSGRLESKLAERQDWFFLMAVNHLLSGMEAYVSGSLYDFPADLRAQALPNGRTGFGFSVPIGRKP